MTQFSGPSCGRSARDGAPGSHRRFRFDILRGEDIVGVNPICDRFHAYWWRIKPAMDLPRRQDFKLPELRGDSRYASILDIGGGRCFDQNFTLQVRLIGTAVAEHFGEMTGHDVADMDNQASARRIYYMSSLAIVERQPVLSVVHAFSADEPYKDVCVLYMPLGNEAGEVCKILAATYVSYFTR